jgi:(E)-4-hydroxy-3-methylbut-2-enyl-diphosphate synthase
MMMHRENTRPVRIGGKVIGGGNPVLIQSMTNTVTSDIDATVDQIIRLEKAGCDIIRCAVTSSEDAAAIKEIKKKIHIPVVADIQFDYRLAVASIENGIDKVRINPGNIGSEDRVREVVSAASRNGVPIRVGVNSGSLNKKILEKYGGVTPEALVESALDECEAIERFGYEDIVISIKTTDVLDCIRAHELIVKYTDHPIHVGITESGTVSSGNIRSGVGIGIILYQGIGDTIRVSLTGDPVYEIETARVILKTLGLRKGGIEVVSCPTCGRTKIDLIDLAAKTEEIVKNYDLDIKVAVMGCAVNGPGEAREADIGIAGGVKEGLLIKKGRIIKKLPESELLSALKFELDNWKE